MREREERAASRKGQKGVYYMTDRELRAYRRNCRRQRERKRRALSLAATLCLILVCAVSYHAITTSAHTDEDGMDFKYYTNITVQSGESLWDIAGDHMDEEHYESRSDYMKEVQHINHLEEGDLLRAGQHIVIPYYSEEFVQ